MLLGLGKPRAGGLVFRFGRCWLGLKKLRRSKVWKMLVVIEPTERNSKSAEEDHVSKAKGKEGRCWLGLAKHGKAHGKGFGCKAKQNCSKKKRCFIEKNRKKPLGKPLFYPKLPGNSENLWVFLGFFLEFFLRVLKFVEELS